VREKRSLLDFTSGPAVPELIKRRVPRKRAGRVKDVVLQHPAQLGPAEAETLEDYRGLGEVAVLVCQLDVVCLQLTLDIMAKSWPRTAVRSSWVPLHGSSGPCSSRRSSHCGVVSGAKAQGIGLMHVHYRPHSCAPIARGPLPAQGGQLHSRTRPVPSAGALWSDLLALGGRASR
jgi:hypothetical protein